MGANELQVLLEQLGGAASQWTELPVAAARYGQQEATAADEMASMGQIRVM